MALDLLSEQEILERVDEYSLYCFYLEFEPIIGHVYQSRLRTRDTRASFGLYERRYGGDLPHEFMWKDQGLPYPNFGDIFDLLVVLFEEVENRCDAMFKVASDFGLSDSTKEFTKKLVITPVKKEPARIRIKSRNFTEFDLNYWNQYNVTESILHRFNATGVEYFFLHDSDKVPSRPKGPMYAYRIFDRYQLYQPNPKFFIMDWTESCIPGFAQLDHGRDLLIITKAMKDIMFFYSLGFNAIAPRAENMIPSPLLLEWVTKNFGRVVTFFDNDGKTSPHLYPFESLTIPLSTGTKDPTDHCKLYGVDATLELINTLLYGR